MNPAPPPSYEELPDRPSLPVLPVSGRGGLSVRRQFFVMLAM